MPILSQLIDWEEFARPAQQCNPELAIETRRKVAELRALNHGAQTGPEKELVRAALFA